MANSIKMLLYFSFVYISFELVESELKAVRKSKDEEIRGRSLQLQDVQRKYDESQIELTQLQLVFFFYSF